MFSWQEQCLTRSLRSLVRYCSSHSKIKFISSRHRVISSIYLFSPVATLYCSFLFASLFVCLVSSVVRALVLELISNLSQGCNFFSFVPIYSKMIFQFIYTSIHWYVFQSVRSFIYILTQQFFISFQSSCLILGPRAFCLACGRGVKRPWHQLATCPSYTLKSWV